VLNEIPRHEDVSMSGDIALRILNLCTEWRRVVSFTHRSLYRRGKNPSTHCIGVWVGSRDDMDAVAKRKKSLQYSCPELISGRPDRSLVTTLTELPRL